MTALQAAYGLRFADVQAVGRDGGSHDLVIQAGVAVVAAQDEGKVASGFGEPVPTVSAPALVHQEHRRSDVDGRQATSTTAAARARIAVAAARAWSRREGMTSTATPEVRIALFFHHARSCASGSYGRPRRSAWREPARRARAGNAARRRRRR